MAIPRFIIIVYCSLGTVLAGVPLRVAAARNRSCCALFSWEPFRLVPTPSNRAGAAPCTRNACWWIATVGCSCLGCER
jgi:hypothetical protein